MALKPDRFALYSLMVLLTVTTTACSRRTQLQCKNMMAIVEPTIENRALMGEGFWAGSADFKNAESELKSMGLTEPPLRNLRTHLVGAYRSMWKAEDTLLQFRTKKGGIRLTSENQWAYDQYVAAKETLKITLEATQNYCKSGILTSGLTGHWFRQMGVV